MENMVVTYFVGTKDCTSIPRTYCTLIPIEKYDRDQKTSRPLDPPTTKQQRAKLRSQYCVAKAFRKKSLVDR